MTLHPTGKSVGQFVLGIGCSTIVVCHLRLGGESVGRIGEGERISFCFGLRCSSSYVHFQSKPFEVLVYQFHAIYEVFSHAKWKCPIVDV